MKKQQLKEKVRMDLRLDHPQFFEPFIGQDLSAQHRFTKGDFCDQTILNFDGKVVLQTRDGGKTWAPYKGPRTFPMATRGIYDFGDELVAINGGTSLKRSFDDGITWGAEEKIPSPDDIHVRGLGAPNCFSAIKTASDSLVLVSDNFLGQEGPGGQLISSHVSKDRGRTWEIGRMFMPAFPLPGGPEGFGEPAVVEMTPGWLWMVMRSLYGELWQCMSRDGGYNWNDPTPTGLVSPIANCYAVQHPDSKAVVLSWNMTIPGVPKDFRSSKSIYRPRTNLVFAISHDRCKTWSCPIVVEEKGGFYPTIYFSEDDMFIMYQSSPDEKKHSWHEYGLGLVAYDRKAVDDLPPWDLQTIQPYIEAGYVRHWLAMNCADPGRSNAALD